jgi:hypothetical protein
MIRRSFDENGDYAINSFISESEATVQAVSTRLKLFLGEWFLDINAGVPWYQKVFVKPAKTQDVEKIIRNTIRETEGIDSLTKFDFNFDSITRSATVAFTATTIYGDEIEPVLGISI